MLLLWGGRGRADKQSAPLREKKEDEEDFVEPTKDERALYMFEQEVKILNNRQENL